MQEEELARITSEAEKEQNKLNLAMQMEMARQKQATKARRARRKTRKAKVTSKLPFRDEGKSNDKSSSAASSLTEPKSRKAKKEGYRVVGDERTKNLLDEAQKLRDLLAASIKRGKDRRRKRRSPKLSAKTKASDTPPPPQAGSKEDEAGTGINLSSLRYLQGKYSPQKQAWGGNSAL